MERERLARHRSASPTSDAARARQAEHEPVSSPPATLGNQAIQAAMRGHASASTAGDLTRKLGGGAPLDARTASQAGATYGESFSDVRVHTDATAARLAGELGASAFTVGNHVAFAGSQYQPGTAFGDALLAHELAHVAQQRGGTGTSSTNGDAYEQDADQAAVGFLARIYAGATALGARAKPALRSGVRLALGDCFKSDKKIAPPASALRDVGDPTKSASYQEWLGTFPTYYSEAGGDEDLAQTTQIPSDLKDYISGTSTTVVPDCADVSILLRHYYLKANKQKSTIKIGKNKSYTIGDGVSDAEVGKVLNDVGTIHFQEDRKAFEIVDWYKSGKKKITNLKSLIAAGLKPGDLFVWKKLDSIQSTTFSGHAQTVAKVSVADQAIEFAQGNMSQGQATGTLELRRRTFQELTGVADGDADIQDTREEYFVGAGPWKQR